jgi:hypothetical protein
MGREEVGLGRAAGASRQEKIAQVDEAKAVREPRGRVSTETLVPDNHLPALTVSPPINVLSEHFYRGLKRLYLRD